MATPDPLWQGLEDHAAADDFPWICHEFVLEANQRTDIDAATWTGSLVRFIEQHPLADHGSPGPLTHFLEDLADPSYCSHLAEALTRAPSHQLLWMVSRMLHSELTDGPRRRLLTALQHAATDPQTPSPVRHDARAFLDQHHPGHASDPTPQRGPRPA